MKAKKDNWLIILCVVESMAILLLAAYQLHRKYGSHIEYYALASHLPNKIAYVAGVDTELDLTGATVIESSNAAYAVGEEYDLVSNLGTHFTVVSEDIDFSTPGIYEVRIRGYDTECVFPIEVIDPAALE